MGWAEGRLGWSLWTGVPTHGWKLVPAGPLFEGFWEERGLLSGPSWETRKTSLTVRSGSGSVLTPEMPRWKMKTEDEYRLLGQIPSRGLVLLKPEESVAAKCSGFTRWWHIVPANVQDTGRQRDFTWEDTVFHFFPGGVPCPHFFVSSNFLVEHLLGLQRSCKNPTAFIHTLQPASPDVNDTQNHSTRIKTRNLTLEQGYSPKASYHLTFVSFSLASSFCLRIQSKIPPGHLVVLSLLFLQSRTPPCMILAIVIRGGQVFWSRALGFVSILNGENT